MPNSSSKPRSILTNRVLLQVKLEDADVTDEIFTRRMGDVVEPRREFIQENALNVANLEVRRLTKFGQFDTNYCRLKRPSSANAKSRY